MIRRIAEFLSRSTDKNTKEKGVAGLSIAKEIADRHNIMIDVNLLGKQVILLQDRNETSQDREIYYPMKSQANENTFSVIYSSQ